MKRKKFILSSVIAAMILVCCGTIAVFASSGIPNENSSKYENVDVNTLTGQGQEPEDISVSSAANYAQKQWYEYVTYSERPVSSYKLSDDTRLIFYDPYDYNSSLIMDVSYDEKNGWSTANSISISHTFSKTFSFEKSEEMSSSSVVERAMGQDYTRTEVESKGESTTKYNHTEKTQYNLDSITAGQGSRTLYTTNETTSTNFSLEGGVDGGATGVVAKIIGGLSHSKTDNSGREETVDSSRTKQIGDTTLSFAGTDSVENNEKSTTEGWTTVADRISESTGSTISTNESWSNTEETTITKTFDAAYFNSSGSPLVWTIAYYEVKMPMKFSRQVRVNNDWITVEDGYCVLTAMDGACRSWKENTVTYYEHWGTGEPVADSDFSGQFFTKEKLLDAYQNHLYPDN